MQHQHSRNNITGKGNSIVTASQVQTSKLSKSFVLSNRFDAISFMSKWSFTGFASLLDGSKVSRLGPSAAATCEQLRGDD